MKNTIVILAFLCSCFYMSAQEETKAIDCIKIYSKHDGLPGSPLENYYAINKCSDVAVRITISFKRGGDLNNNAKTKSFDLEPGEKKKIHVKRQYNTSYSAHKTGARFL